MTTFSSMAFLAIKNNLHEKRTFFGMFSKSSILRFDKSWNLHGFSKLFIQELQQFWRNV